MYLYFRHYFTMQKYPSFHLHLAFEQYFDQRNLEQKMESYLRPTRMRF